jgi:hypothetical protein
MAPLAVLLSLTAWPARAAAWGCDGHRATAIVAERLVDPATTERVRSVLTASPVDPTLQRGCEVIDQASDPIVISQIRLAGARLASVLKAAFP